MTQSEATEKQVTKTDTSEESTISDKESDIPQTSAEIITRIKALAESPLSASKEELDSLKQIFYKLRRATVDTAKEEHIANGGTSEDFKVDTTEEDEFKAAMNIIKEKRAEQQREEERIREENGLRKEAILDRIQAMVDNADKEQASYNDFKALQQEWNSIGEVPATKQTYGNAINN
jgi:hypothetical protein